MMIDKQFLLGCIVIGRQKRHAQMGQTTQKHLNQSETSLDTYGHAIGKPSALKIAI